jgi:uncharacterized protein HemX
MAQEQEQSPEQEGAAEEAVEATAGENAGAPTRRGRGAYWLGALALLVALAGVGAGAYAYWRIDHRFLALDQSLTQLDQSLSQEAGRKQEIQDSLADLRTSLESIRQGQGDLGARDDQLAQRLATIEKATQDLRAQLESGPAFWRLERIENLLVTADRVARLEGDAQAAYAALKSADDALRNLKDPGWLEVRKAIQGAMTRLEQVPETDVAGITYRLDSLMETALELPLKGAEPRQMGPEEAAEEAAGPASEAEGAWAQFKQGMGEFWADVKDLVRLRRGGEEVEPLIPPDKAGFLRHNLVLNLQSARMAALQGKDEVFDASLAQAADWTERFFDPQSDAVRAMTSALQGLQERSVDRSLPALEAPLRTFRQVRQERES